jgi:hypothetical protein
MKTFALTVFSYIVYLFTSIRDEKKEQWVTIDILVSKKRR